MTDPQPAATAPDVERFEKAIDEYRKAVVFFERYGGENGETAYYRKEVMKLFHIAASGFEGTVSRISDDPSGVPLSWVLVEHPDGVPWPLCASVRVTRLPAESATAPNSDSVDSTDAARWRAFRNSAQLLTEGPSWVTGGVWFSGPVVDMPAPHTAPPTPDEYADALLKQQQQEGER